MAGHGSRQGPSTNTSTIPELYMLNRTVSRDQSITFSPYILFLEILFSDLLCSRVCSKFQHFAQSLATTLQLKTLVVKKLWRITAFHLAFYQFLCK